MILPADHPQRQILNDEVHARPSEYLAAPLRISFLALLSDWSMRDQQWRRVADLAERFGVAPPAANANHYSADLGAFRIKWERHTEFERFKFIVPGGAENPFAEPAIDRVPAEFVAGLTGKTIVATNIAFVPADSQPLDYLTIAARFFDGNTLVGASVAGAGAIAVTDYRIRADGFSRLLVLDHGTTPRQAGRTVQRLVEIDAYRMLSLLALPVARDLAPFLSTREQELAQVTANLVGAGEADEPILLDRLAQLEAEIESRQAENRYRFSASGAYYELVLRRIGELREGRLEGLQTFQEFTERRMAPAMNLCLSVAARQESLSQRVARATQMLSTRVDISRERQNLDVLASMDRRAQIQLRLQETVEGLSVAAITYYIVGLVGHAVESAEGFGLHVNKDIVIGLSIPVVATLAWLGIRRIRKNVTKSAE